MTGQGRLKPNHFIFLEFALIAAVVITVTLPRIVSPNFCLDDSYIHLAYVKSIRLGDGPSYNPSDWETGMSSPLWVFLLSLWPFGIPSILIIKCIGTLLHVLTAFLMVLLVNTLARNKPYIQADLLEFHQIQLSSGFFSGLLFAVTPLWVQGATSGMETSLATLLIIASSYTIIRHFYAASFLLALLSYLARPETVVYTGCLSFGLTIIQRRFQPLSLGLGGALGVIIWGIYCFSVSGYFWPNTYYIKGELFYLNSLLYLLQDVCAWQPVFASITGTLLMALILYKAVKYKKWDLLLIFLSAVATLLAIALTRKLHPTVLFFESRHFTIALWIAPFLAGCGINTLRLPYATALVLPLLVVNSLMLYSNNSLQKEQERGVRRVHIDIAEYVNENLPPETVLAVEGAGALRFFTPRSMKIIDIIGLNERRIAHQGNKRYGAIQKLCFIHQQNATHIAYLEQWSSKILPHLKLHTLAIFTEPRYAQNHPPVRWTVILAKIVSARNHFKEYCKKLVVQKD